MATDRLMNHTQGESIVSALQTIAQKSETPYNASNKLPTDYADDTNQTNKFATAAQLEQIELNKNNILSIYDTGYAQKNVMRIVLDEVKALLPSQPFVGNTTTFGNLSVTFNEDNSITLNGSHTAAVAINFKDLSHINMPTNAVGAASANITLSNDIFFGLWGDSGVSNLVLNDGVDIPSDYASKYSRGFVIRVSANTVCNNVQIYPMVCDKALYQASSEVVSYALPNTVITPALKECVDNEKKNELDCNVSTLTPLNTFGTWSGNTYSINGGTTTFVVNSDLTITVSKSDTGIARSMTLCNYTDGSKLNGKVISGGHSNVTIIVQKNGGNYQTYATSTGDGALIDGIPGGQATRIVISIASDVTCTNVVIKPMLCKKSLYDVSPTYQPYVLSNAELTVEVKPSAYSNPTPQSTDITLQSGGYYKIGNSVTVCIRATVSNAITAWTPIFSGFPVPIADDSITENSAVIAVGSNAGVGIGITKRGIMQGFDAIPAGTLLLNCTYLCV